MKINSSFYFDQGGFEGSFLFQYRNILISKLYRKTFMIVAIPTSAQKSRYIIKNNLGSQSHTSTIDYNSLKWSVSVSVQKQEIMYCNTSRQIVKLFYDGANGNSSKAIFLEKNWI